MLRRLLFVRCLLVLLGLWLGVFAFSLPASAGKIDPYVIRYLHVNAPIALNLDREGNTKEFSPEDLSAGKGLFKQHCLTCHVGGATLPNPPVSLSLEKLAGATPPRDTINGLVNYFRRPLNYNGSEENDLCRQVPETWLSQQQVESLAAFILTAAQKAPGWGTDTP